MQLLCSIFRTKLYTFHWLFPSVLHLKINMGVVRPFQMTDKIHALQGLWANRWRNMTHSDKAMKQSCAVSSQEVSCKLPLSALLLGLASLSNPFLFSRSYNTSTKENCLVKCNSPKNNRCGTN